MMFGAFIGFVLFVATICVGMGRLAVVDRDRFVGVIFWATALALFVVAGMALA